MNYKNFNDYLSRTQNTQSFGDRNVLHTTTSSNESIPIPNHTTFSTTTLKNNLLVVDSRDRDTARFPLSNRFNVAMNTSSQYHTSDSTGTGYFSQPNQPYDGATLEQTYKNVRQIKIEECIVPNFVDDHPYLILTIPEWKDTIGGTNDTLRNAFALLIPERIQGIFVTCKKTSIYCKKMFDPPLAKLQNFTVEFHQPDGTLYSFLNNDEIMLMLNICCEIPAKNQILNYQIV